MKQYPHMSYKRTDIINHLVNKYQYKSYLEIGTRNVDSNYAKIKIPHKESIDPNPRKGKVTYQMTSDDAFKIIKKQNKTFDIIFIDGLHVAEQVDRDIQNGLDVLNENGTVVLHDCNPITEKHAVPYKDYLKNPGMPWNGTVWQSIAKVRTTRSDLSVWVVDTDWGCGLIRRMPSVCHQVPPGIDIYNYDYLAKNRTKLLNLISVQKFKELFS